MTRMILFVLLTISANAFSQNVYVAEGKSQPLVYRKKTGEYYGCGIRTVFTTDVPKPYHLGDISVNIFRQDSGNVVGLVKIIYSRIDNIKDLNSTKNLPISKFMFANASGKALKLGEIQSGEIPNTYLAQASSVDTITYLADVSGGKTTEVGVTLKNSDGSMKIFSLKGSPLIRDEVKPLSNCIVQLSPN